MVPLMINPILGLNMVNGICIPIIKIGVPKFIPNYIDNNLV